MNEVVKKEKKTDHRLFYLNWMLRRKVVVKMANVYFW